MFIREGTCQVFPLRNLEGYYRCGVLPDGNCFIHTIAKATSTVYNRSYIVQEEVPKDLINYYREFVEFEDELFTESEDKTSFQVNDTKRYTEHMKDFRVLYATVLRKSLYEAIMNNLEVYKKIYPHELEIFKGEKPEDLDENLKEKIHYDFQEDCLLSSQYSSIIGKLYDRDVYIITADHYINYQQGNSDSLLFDRTEHHLDIKGPDCRQSIVIFYHNYHYELISRKIDNVMHLSLPKGDELAKILFKELTE